MPEITVRVVLGVNSRDPVWEAPVLIPDAGIDLAEETLAEFDVLEMPVHDDHYAAGALSALYPGWVGAINPPAPLARATRKSSAPNVVGNIGEGLGVAVLAYLSGIRFDEITRVRRQKWRERPEAQRTPDFVCSPTPGRTGAALIGALLKARADADVRCRLDDKKPEAAYPDRFPVEAKGTLRSAGNGFWSGVWQLIEYWALCSAQHLPDEIGYGVLLNVRAIGCADRCVDVHVFTPAVPTDDFQDLIRPLPAERGTKDAFSRLQQENGGRLFIEYAML